MPARLRIPTIKLNAPVERVGLAANGAMDTPYDPSDTAWFQQGPRPGEPGSAVIDGHFGAKGGKAAIFDNLHKVKAGDQLYVDDDQGMTSAFVVRSLKVYGKDADASSVFSASDSKAHLNLITCEGTWNKAQASYSDRLVVFSDKE